MPSQEAGSWPPPLKHVLLYEWEFRTAQSLAEVAERLREARFYVASPRDDVLVITSLARPGAIVIVMSQRTQRGGELLVIQTPSGPYRFEDLVRAVPVFARLAGIRLTGFWPKESA